MHGWSYVPPFNKVMNGMIADNVQAVLCWLFYDYKRFLLPSSSFPSIQLTSLWWMDHSFNFHILSQLTMGIQIRIKCTLIMVHKYEIWDMNEWMEIKVPTRIPVPCLALPSLTTIHDYPIIYSICVRSLQASALGVSLQQSVWGKETEFQ